MERKREGEPTRSNISCPRMHRGARRASNACRKINIIHARLRTNLFRHSRTRLPRDIGCFVKNVRNSTLSWSNESRHPFVDREDAFQMPRGEMFSPATVHVERKLYRQLLRKLPRRAMGAFLSLSFFFYFFSTAIGTASYEIRQRRGRRGCRAWNEGLQAVPEFQYRSSRAPWSFWNNQTVLSRETIPLMHLKTVFVSGKKNFPYIVLRSS